MKSFKNMLRGALVLALVMLFAGFASAQLAVQSSNSPTVQVNYTIPTTFTLTLNGPTTLTVDPATGKTTTGTGAATVSFTGSYNLPANPTNGFYLFVSLTNMNLGTMAGGQGSIQPIVNGVVGTGGCAYTNSFGAALSFCDMNASVDAYGNFYLYQWAITNSAQGTLPASPAIGFDLTSWNTQTQAGTLGFTAVFTGEAE